MDDNNKEQFRKLLHDKFNNNLKELNQALVKYIELIERKKQANQSAYQRHKDNEEFMKKKKDYDKQYYTEHKHNLLSNRKDKYNNDNEYRENIKLKQKSRYVERNKLRIPALKSDGSGN